MKQIIYNIDSFDPGTLYTEDIRTGENLSTELIINLSEEFIGYTYLLALQNNDDAVVVSSPLIPNEDDQLIFPIPYVVLQHEGLLKIEVNAYETDGTTVTLAKSAIIYLNITAALTAGCEVIPTDYVPWYVLTAEMSADAVASAQYIAGILPDLEPKIAEATDINNTLTDTTIPNATSINTTITETTIPNATSINTTLTDTTIPNAQTINTTLTETTTPSATLINSTLTDTTIPNANSINSTLTDTTIPTATSINSTLTDTTTPNATAINNTLTNTTIPNATSIDNTLSTVTTPAATSINSTLVNTTIPAATSINNTITNTTIPLANSTQAALELAIASGSVDNINEKVGTIQNEVKTIEDTILQMNPNGDAKITVTSFDTVNSLPKNAAQAGLGVVQEGMTASNLVINGDFSNGTTGWGVVDATQSVSNGILTLLATAQYGFTGKTLPTALISGDKYFISALLKTASAHTSIQLVLNDGAGQQTVACAATTNWQTVSGIITWATSGASKAIRVRDARASGWDNTQIDYIRLTNLTAIAKQAATLSQADAMLLDYFSGTQSAVTGRVRSVGKNTFHVSQIVEYAGVKKTMLDDRSFRLSMTIYTVAVKAINAKFKSGTRYTFSGLMNYVGTNRGFRFQIYYTDGTNETLYTPPATKTAFTKTSAVGKTIDFIGYNASDNNGVIEIYDFQAEEGTVATTYEPYRKTESYTKPMPLLRLPSAADDVTNGKHSKKIFVKTLTTNDIYSLLTPNVNVDIVRIYKPTDYRGYGNNRYPYQVVDIYFDGVTGTEYADNVAAIGHIYTIDNTAFGYLVPKGLYADVAAAKSALAGTVIYYQLATPIITENVSSGTLLAYPSGTVYWEPVIADVAIYATGASILNTGYPISSLESIYKIDLVTGEQTPLAVASATVASGGLSFTHTGLVDGDLVGFTYYFAHALPYGENDYTYYDSNEVSIDTVTGRAYKLRAVVTNGAFVTWTPVEVV